MPSILQTQMSSRANDNDEAGVFASQKLMSDLVKTAHTFCTMVSLLLLESDAPAVPVLHICLVYSCLAVF